MNIIGARIEKHKLQELLAKYLPLYAAKDPHYQVIMLESLLEVWAERHSRVLDIGGGTGLMAQAMADLFPVEAVEAIDVVDRFCPTLTIGHQRYDGQNIPFENGAFDAATLNNVVHHVPIEIRSDLFREIRRAIAGPVYVKDHIATSRIDHLRLVALDAWGNIPFRGQVWAKYLTHDDWQLLATKAGYRIAAIASPGVYRTGAVALAFPNRLEITMRLEPL